MFSMTAGADWAIAALRAHPEIAFFATLALGYLLGKLRIAGFSLGAVTGTLLAGVLIGQFGVRFSDDVKQVAARSNSL